MKKYRKTTQKRTKISIYVLIGIVCGVSNLISLAASYQTIEVSNAISLQQIVPIASFIVSCTGILYCVIQDIIRIYNEKQPQFIWEQTTGIPFVDREELLTDVLSGILGKITDCSHYYSKNIRYGVHNGKKSFAQKLCWELQRIKNEKNAQHLYGFSPQIASRLGNIFFVNYAHYTESFELHVKNDFVYIKGKLNIVVVLNSCNNSFIWSDSLQDDDVFFVLLNFNTNATDDLFFADDKIVELLRQIKDIPAYASICAGKSESEICTIASKLGNISNNNIGTIINLLASSDFNLLLETDQSFVDFYLALKHGHYKEAESRYKILPKPSPANKVLYYKFKYEEANLEHFLGRYENATQSLDLLVAEMAADADKSFISGNLGKGLLFSTTLLQAHVLKHQGKFDDAALMLCRVEDEQKNILWLRAHFAINIFQINEVTLPSSEWKKLLDSLNEKMDAFLQQRKLINSDYYFYEAFSPIPKFYTSEFNHSIIPDLIKIEDQAIAYYEIEERRYLTNCYYIKAELLRINQQWKEAEDYYGRCYDIYSQNGDKDILYLVAYTCKCLQEFEKIFLNIPFDWDAAISECKQQEGYGFHQRLISKMELASVNQETREYWLAKYRVTINPIP